MSSYKFIHKTLLYFLVFLFSNCVSKSNISSGLNLWPETKPFKTGYIKVSDIHKVYYELSGNPKGIPVFVLHGGPGAGCKPYNRQFFDPNKYLIVMHDQRGCGKSEPTNELTENTTMNLIEDIEQLRMKLNLDKIILFGGSWGSTLGLAYAEKYPENVSAMIFRGIFLGTKYEDEIYWQNIRNYFPDVYNKFISQLPDSALPPTSFKMFKLIQSPNEIERKKYTKLIDRLEYKSSGLSISEKELDDYYGDEINYNETYTMALIEYHYITNDFFLIEDQLIKGLSKIKSIPMIIVNGRYDMICPPVTAYKLHHDLPLSKLFIIEEAGHMMSEKPIESQLIKIMNEFKLTN